MRRFPSGAIIAWVVAVLFLFSSISLLLDGKIGPFFTGLAISAVLAFCGWRTYVKQWGWKEHQDFEDQSSYQPNNSVNESYVYVSRNGNGKKYHRNSQCARTHSQKMISYTEAKKQGYAACKKCDTYWYLDQKNWDNGKYK